RWNGPCWFQSRQRCWLYRRWWPGYVPGPGSPSIRWKRCVTLERMRRGLVLLTAGAMLAAGQEQPAVTFGTTIVVPGGLEGVVYHISKRSKVIPDFRKIKPQGKIYVSALNIPLRDFTEGFPGVTKREEWFAIDYTGRFWIEKPGLYGFALTSDDGSRLYIDDQMVVDNDGIHPIATHSGIVELSGGI